MNKDLRLSIVTICYNEAARIEETLRSVIEQTFQDFQYIVVDGASTDGTLDILKRYEDHIDVLISEPDNGIYNAMNKAIDYCKGDYIYFLNGGDVLYRKETLANIFSHDIKGSLIYGNIAIKPVEGEQWVFEMPAKLTKPFLLRKTIPHQATFTHRKVFKEIGKYDETYRIAADYKLSLQAIYEYEFDVQYVREVFALFDAGGIGTVNHKDREKEKSDIQKEVFRETLQHISKENESSAFTSRLPRVIKKIILKII